MSVIVVRKLCHSCSRYAVCSDFVEIFGGDVVVKFA